MPIKTHIASIRINEKYTNESGIRELHKILKEKSIDIFAVQGISDTHYAEIVRTMRNAGYNHNRFPDIHEDIFYKPRAAACDKVRFKNTAQGKGWTLYNLEFGTQNVIFVTAVLEEDAEGLVDRKKQIAEIERYFGGHQRVVFMGDTCITSYQRTLDKPRGWYDAWEEVGVPDNEFTYDGGKNSYVNTQVRDRRERIWYKGVIANKFGLLTEMVDPPVSDHFGVWAEIEFESGEPEEEVEENSNSENEDAIEYL